MKSLRRSKNKRKTIKTKTKTNRGGTAVWKYYYKFSKI
jgi:hypothetical protein